MKQTLKERNAQLEKELAGKNRELEIEAALERVRSRSVAMHKSKELLEVANVLFQQLRSFGGDFWALGICICKPESEEDEFYFANENGIVPRISIPHTQDPTHKRLYDGWKDKEVLATVTKDGKELKAHYDYMLSVPSVKGVFQVFLDAGLRFPTWQRWHAAYFSHGYIMLITTSPYTEEQLLVRFAKVFDQAYTRFLDLQKAEVHAREAQIELGLERVRARTMTMQKSDELLNIIIVLSEQLQYLNLKFDNVSFGVNNPDYDLQLWMAIKGNPKAYKIQWTFLDNPGVTRLKEAQRHPEKVFADVLTRKENNKWLQHIFKCNPGLDIFSDENKHYLLNTPGYARSILVMKDIFLVVGNYAAIPYTDEENIILKRFANVFDQTYTRFLDLQKAEAQTREAQIELGLERVRAKAMAMQKSDELKELIGTVFTELTKLDLALTRSVIWIFDAETNGTTWWMANSEDPENPMDCYIPYSQHPRYLAFLEQWEKRSIKFQYELKGENKKNWDDYLFSKTGLARLPGIVIEGMKAPEKVWLSASFNNFGAMHVTSLDPLSDEHFDILLRFAKVFDLTYTRFNDLKQAEAQAREAEIQLALERVRARTMAMQKSEELAEAAEEMFKQVNALGSPEWSCGFDIFDQDEKSVTQWISGGHGLLPPFKTPLTEHSFFKTQIEARHQKTDFLIMELGGQELKDLYDYIFQFPDAKKVIDQIKYTGLVRPEFQVMHFAFFSQGFLIFITYEPVPEMWNIFKRFAKVFEQTYTRFLDLQKAEAQAREAQIEAALERVRSRTMGMHKSTDLLEVISVLSEQFLQLGFKIHSANFNTSYREKDWNLWLYNPGTPMYPDQIYIPYLDNPFFNRTLESIANGADFTAFVFTKEEKDRFLDHIYTNTLAKNAPEERKKFSYNAPGFAWSTVYLKNTALTIANYDAEPYSEEQNSIIRRFGNVFEQSYTRFLDLQKAEAQAKEATIEASLERVRGKAMSMHSSRDLADTVEVFYHEVELLSITPRRCGVGLMDKETHVAELSTMNTTEQGDSIEIIGKLKLTGHPVLEGVYDNWILQKEYHPVLRGNEIKEYYQLMRPQIAYPDHPTDTAQYGYFFFFKEGGVYAWTEKELSEDELKIYRRFTSVLSLTYKRYKDLKDAEANTHEAIKRASLDRVRAETASMRTTGDLEKITPLIWNELTTLKVPFIRCGVFIMDEQQEQIHSFLSTPDGKAIAAFQLPYDSAGELSKVLAHWHKKEIYKDHWDEAAFAAWTKSLVEQGAIASEEKYSTAHRPTKLDLHFLPFLQGMLYVGSEAPLSDEEIHLVQGLADAFSTAYARYEDFNKLEAAKKQVDSTLNELQATQKQLVQSEKMASLGELTAGIAHEIQNPLNFVNNFSDVNKELLIEMKDEMQKGNIEDAKAIADDVIENEEKINHHGKRAGDIVKGMLQHSRKSTGQKEPTDINALADEYLRLSYHGLRAKDKEFNATMKTNFDNSIGKINIVPQDIGRVLLNLFNNAFYAVNEQKNKNLISYQPTVTVRTFLNLPLEGREAVIITVSDNGNGIPKNIVDKIFQPFFTTKPTGQGTGLGLSLSYDIVKAHGGEIKVETKENKETTFIIQLPLN